MANPGFPVGGGGHRPLTCVLSVKMYAKMKELGPVGRGNALGTSLLDSPMEFQAVHIPSSDCDQRDWLHTCTFLIVTSLLCYEYSL